MIFLVLKSIVLWLSLFLPKREPWTPLRQEDHHYALYELTCPIQPETAYSRIIHQSPLNTDFTNSRINQPPLSPDFIKLSHSTLSTDLLCHTPNQSPTCLDPSNHTVDQIPITTELDYRQIQPEITVDFDYSTVHRSDVYHHIDQPKPSEDIHLRIIDPLDNTDYGHHTTINYDIVQQYSKIPQSPGTEKTPRSVIG